MRSALLVLATSILTFNAAAAEVMEASYALPDGKRVLRHEVLVNAPPDAVWQAFTTSEGLQTFAAPLASIDLRAGGAWEASYRSGARLGDPRNIRNEVLSFVPGEMLSLRVVSAPPDFPHAEFAKKVFTVVQLLRINDPATTRVRVSMLPYGSGAGWDEVYNIFREENARVLRRLEKRFATGPIDWTAK